MAFAQLRYRESLRDIEACVRAVRTKLYYMGIRGKVSRSTLADTNEARDWRIYADLAHVLIHTSRRLYINNEFGGELDHTVYAAGFKNNQSVPFFISMGEVRKNTVGAIKMHTVLDLRGNIPSFIRITNAKVHEVNILEELIPEAESFYVMDRGYLEFSPLYSLTLCFASFITRLKSNFRFRRLYSHPVEKSTSLKCDQRIVLTGFYSSKGYPGKLRHIRYFNVETQKDFSFLTNNFTLPALRIAQLYNCGWQVELFFKWIKQHLRIKGLYGTSQNAVKTQIWILICVYVLVAIIKKELHLSLEPLHHSRNFQYHSFGKSSYFRSSYAV